jgi:hypothetical protein
LEKRAEVSGSFDEEGFVIRVPPLDLTGDEPLSGIDGPDISVRDYWRWAHSDISENVQRGVFAEYLVAVALGVNNEARVGWTGYDLDYAGKKIEVKSSAYLQSWLQRSLTRPVFSIAARQQWIEKTGAFEDPRRVADCYIFCLYHDRAGANADILDVSRWTFYALSISSLIRHCQTAKTLSLTRLETITLPVGFGGLKDRVDEVLAGVEFRPEPSALPARKVADEAARALVRRTRVYRVCKRKTYEHPVIVSASNYKDAQILARVDPTIASFGSEVSAFELSEPKLNKALAAGAMDLR